MKVYSVAVQLEINMAVVADSKEEAEEIANDSLDDDLDYISEDIEFQAREIKECTTEFKGALPYIPHSFLDNDDVRHNWTVDQWIEQLAVDTAPTP
jgi:hypothetical protein